MAGTKELTVVLVRRGTGTRLMVTVKVDGKKDPRRVALDLQRQKYPDFMVMEVAVERSEE